MTVLASPIDQPITLEKAVAVAADLAPYRPDEGYRLLAHGFYLARRYAEVDPDRGQFAAAAWCERLLQYAMEHGITVDTDLS